MWKKAFCIILPIIFLLNCSNAMLIPYLEIEVNDTYTSSNVIIEYEYQCEDNEQRCVYTLCKKIEPEKALFSEDKLMPNAGELIFSSLSEGDYRLTFSVYTYKNGKYTLLNYLRRVKDFSVDLP